jgi:penicillin-binding protein 1A
MRTLSGLLLLAAVGALATIATGSNSWSTARLEDPLEPLLDYRPPAASVVYDRHGRTIARYFVQRRQLVHMDEIPEHVIGAFVASEDAQFFLHGGLDFPGMLRAAWINVRGGRIRQGASTITQQVVKNVLLSPERTWTRKLREMLLALQVEQRLSKQEILLVYLNHIYLGNGSYGVGDAARCYFGKQVAELDLSEAALLAGLPRRPSAYSPTKHPAAAEARRRHVLEQMLAGDFVTPVEYRVALDNPPHIRKPSRQTHSLEQAEHFSEEVRRELVYWFGSSHLYGGGLQVETSLDLELQQEARLAVRRGLEALDRRQGWRGPLRRVAPEQLDDSLFEVGWENRWAHGARREAGSAEEDLRLGLVLASSTDSRGWEVANVGLAPDTVVEVELEPAVWGLAPAAPGSPTRVLRVGDVARFRVGDAPEGLSASLYQEPLVEGSLLSMDVATGEVLAMVGGYDFERSEFNRAVQARRQPGSAFKPFVYAAAVEAGYTQASFVLDSPNLFWDSTGESVWRPRNYGRRFLGWLTLRRALAQSVNNATIQLARRVGVDQVVGMARRLGIESELRSDLSLALGSSEISLLELTRAYASFPTGGRPVRARFIRRVLDRDGRVLLDDLGLGEREGRFEGGDRAGAEPDLRSEARAVSPAHARIVTDLLQGAVYEPGATGARAQQLPAKVAGKTGTTNGNRDAWFVGFSPDVATGVWVGFDSPRSLGSRETGSRAALPIWVDYMAEALAASAPRNFDVPEDISFARVDSRTGRLAAPGGSRSSWQAFVAGTEPRWRPAPRRQKQASRRELLLDDF